MAQARSPPRTPDASVVSLTDLIDLGAGGSSSCAVLEDGSAWCWGANTHGELGDGTFAPSSSLVQVLSP